MYTLYTADTPNGRKIPIALEELELPYRVRQVDLGAGEQHTPEFLRISPNNKIPAIVDERSGQAIFESGAILIHLADEAGRLLPKVGPGRDAVLQWLFMQVGSVGPMLGQLWWFKRAAPQPIEIALARYEKEAHRLFKVVDGRLAESRYFAGEDYSIADIAMYPWLASHTELDLDLTPYPAVRDWLQRVGARPATQRGLRKNRASGDV